MRFDAQETTIDELADRLRAPETSTEPEHSPRPWSPASRSSSISV